jgi:hypothetical protein
MNETAVQPKPERNKLTLNKETVRVLTDREMLDVEGGTCGSPHSTCSTFFTDGCNTHYTCTGG